MGEGREVDCLSFGPGKTEAWRIKLMLVLAFERGLALGLGGGESGLQTGQSLLYYHLS